MKEVRLVLEKETKILPFTYDVKVALLHTLEETATQLVKRGERNLALATFRDELKLFHKGPKVCAEGFQYLATTFRADGLAKEVGEKKGLRKKSWLRRFFGKKNIELALNELMFDTFCKKLINHYRYASENKQLDRVRDSRQVFKILNLKEAV